MSEEFIRRATAASVFLIVLGCSIPCIVIFVGAILTPNP